VKSAAQNQPGFLLRLYAEARRRVGSYILVGLLNTIIGYGMFSLLFFLIGANIGLVPTLLITHVLATSVGYFNLSRVTFSDSSGKNSWLKYQGFYILPLVTNILVVPAIIDLWAVNTYMAQGLFAVFYAGLAYFYHLVVTFGTTSEDKRGD